MKVLMLPQDEGQGTSGIAQVVRAYKRHLPEYGIELVSENATSYDLYACHVDLQGRDHCDVLHNHGLYWTADYPPEDWQYRVNYMVIEAIRRAKEVTVPSAWVAETFQRDMRFTPHVISHGIEWDEWQGGNDRGGYVLWNKNRAGVDVCDPTPLGWLTNEFSDVQFVSTFAPEGAGSNLTVTGVQPHHEMKRLVQGAGVYLATAKETFGIGILEAMASGVPVLGFAHGGILGLVRHGVNGYLAGPGNLEDLATGLAYCLAHAETLGENGREMAKGWTWQAACERVAQVYKLALAEEPPTVTIVIPSYMYAELVGRAIESAITQTYGGITDIIVVDDGSDDGRATERIVAGFKDHRMQYIRQDNQGVAVARNRGISACNTKYVCCLDADDKIEPTFIEECVAALEADPALGVAYTGLKLRLTDGRIVTSPWPGQCDFDQHLAGNNQVPTCCVFRRKAWERLGGYRQRYAPHGCGTEDAEFWLRMGAHGWGIEQATTEPLFKYTIGGRTMSTPEYKEVDWRVWHPWTSDHKHPFASIATPRQLSHPVRQYDEPVISVVIPVGPGHERDVVNALDSLEAQSFRKWEVIVVWDLRPVVDPSERLKVIDPLYTAYPYVQFHFAERFGGKFGQGPFGAGYARNRGVEMARAPFLFFLDADDWLFPQALESLLLAELENDSDVGAFSDHVGLAVIKNPKYLRSLREAGRLIEYSEEDGHAVVRHFTKEFVQNIAIRQPDLKAPYLWCNISTLIPTAWHFEVGGFDEAMWSWEDWDYWLRLAKRGKMFVRVPEPLLVYRYYSGNRREDGKEVAPESSKLERWLHG